MLGGGGGVSHPLQLTTGLVIKSITTSPTLAGEHMLFILQVSILSEQIQAASEEKWRGDRRGERREKVKRMTDRKNRYRSKEREIIKKQDYQALEHRNKQKGSERRNS